MNEGQNVDGGNTVITAPGNANVPEPVNNPTGDAPINNQPHTVPYSKFKEVRDENKDLRNLVASATSLEMVDNKPTPQPTPPAPQPSEPTQPQAVTREDLDRSNRVTNRIIEANFMSMKHDGQDGLPRFDIEKITDFMKSKGYVSLSYEDAYNLMHQEEIVAHRIKTMNDNNTGQTIINGAPTAGIPNSQVPTIQGMSLDEFKKRGGADGLRDLVLSGKLK